MSALALPVAPLRESRWARPKSTRWAEGDALIVIPRVGLAPQHVHAHGLLAKLRGIAMDLLYGQAHEQAILTATFGGTALTAVTTAFLCLVTTAVANTDTSASLVEPTYTGYTRVSLSGKMGAASGGNPASIANNATITGTACTAGGPSTVIGYSITDTGTIAGAGRNLVYGTCTSVVISPTQTPPTVAIGALTATQT